jgi:hypothetical protein
VQVCGMDGGPPIHLYGRAMARGRH